MSLKLASRLGAVASRPSPRTAFASVAFARRAQSSRSAEGQQKVQKSSESEGLPLTPASQLQLLTLDLEHGDPQVYEILQKVSDAIAQSEKTAPNTAVGKTSPEALHQPDSIGELHVASCS